MMINLILKSLFSFVFIWVKNKKTINDVYFDRAGFGSKSRTLKEAREKDKTITMSNILTSF